MTKKADLLRVFGFSSDTPRIGAYGVGAQVLHDPERKSDAVAVTVELLDKDSKEPTDLWLALQVSPASAVTIASAIVEIAKERGWELPPILRDSFPTASTKH